MTVGVGLSTYPAPLRSTSVASHVVTSFIFLSSSFTFGAVFDPRKTASCPKPQVCVPADRAPATFVSLEITPRAALGVALGTGKWFVTFVYEIVALFVGTRD